MVVDYHTHSNYSDGVFLWRMLDAAEDIGLDAIGFADHCNVSDRPEMVRQKKKNGFNLDMTYERRRVGFEQLRDRFDIRIFDAVEIDYHPDDEPQIRSFLDEAGFDYVVGSVHFVHDVNIHSERYFGSKSKTERRDVVDTYFDHLIDMIDAGIVDIVAHPDVFERNAVLRGLATRQQYERVAAAFERSEAVPEINAGRLLKGYGHTHPRPDMLDVLVEADIRFTFGTDSHTPDQLKERVPALQNVFADRGLEPVHLPL